MFKRSAFTLIELLVVVVVIGILAAVAVQSFATTRIRAQDTNVKGSVQSYNQAMELYYAQYKTYFVHNQAQSCNPQIDAGLKNQGQYALVGDGSGCVGLRGGSQGQITRRQGTGLANYKTLSIADALVASGVLNKIETYPGVDSFSEDVKVDGKNLPADFVLTLCDDTGHQAQSRETATNFTIYATLKRPSGPEMSSSKRMCGASGTEGAWNITSAY